MSVGDEGCGDVGGGGEAVQMQTIHSTYDGGLDEREEEVAQ